MLWLDVAVLPATIISTSFAVCCTKHAKCNRDWKEIGHRSPPRFCPEAIQPVWNRSKCFLWWGKDVREIARIQNL
ncbi:hypothetical protein C8R45DRAFT_999287 [Mycena sanguinolenta]|nr:hypothetical protein C8R45DRAFT_999287 [Mycena sanguinolenta]